MKKFFYLCAVVCMHSFAQQEPVIYVKDVEAQPLRENLLAAPSGPIRSYSSGQVGHDDQMQAYLNARNTRVRPNLTCKEKCCICKEISLAVAEGCLTGLVGANR